MRERQIPTIIDTDIGLGHGKADVDDAIALLVALASPRLNILGITTVSGNVRSDVATCNLFMLLERIKRKDILIGYGCAEPIGGTNSILIKRWSHSLTNAERDLLREIQITREDSVSFIIERLLEAKEPVYIVAIGPLTNIALCLTQRPDLREKIKQIILMGGSTIGGKVTPVAEFNIWADPEAARIVFRSGLSVVFFPLDITTSVPITPDSIRKWNNQGSEFLKYLHKESVEYMHFRSERYGIREAQMFFHDVMPVMYIAQALSFIFEDCNVEVECSGSLTRGMTIVGRGVWAGETPIHRMAVNVDHDSFLKKTVDLITENYRSFE